MSSIKSIGHARPFGGSFSGLSRRLLALSLAFGFAGFAAGQPPAGSVEGRIRNAVTGENLNHATVAVKGTTRVVLTDDTGSYRLDNLPAGPVTLRVFFTGLDPQE